MRYPDPVGVYTLILKKFDVSTKTTREYRLLVTNQDGSDRPFRIIVRVNPRPIDLVSRR